MDAPWAGALKPGTFTSQQAKELVVGLDDGRTRWTTSSSKTSVCERLQHFGGVIPAAPKGILGK